MKELKILSKNVKKIVECFMENRANYLDFEEDYDYLTSFEKKELFAILNFICLNSNVRILDEV